MASKLSRIKGACSTFADLIGGLWRGPYWWMVPLMFIFLPAALLFIFLQAVPGVAPFVYTLF